MEQGVSGNRLQESSHGIVAKALGTVSALNAGGDGSSGLGIYGNGRQRPFFHVGKDDRADRRKNIIKIMTVVIPLARRFPELAGCARFCG